MSSTSSDSVHLIEMLLQEHPRGFPASAIARRLSLHRGDTIAILESLRGQGRVQLVHGRYIGAESPSKTARVSESEPTTSRANPEGLEALRRICAFHADVVQELASSKLNLEDDDARLQKQVPTDLDWFLLANDQLEVPRRKLPPLKWKSGSEERVMFAGPLHLMERRRRGGKAERVWMPVFLVHARPRRLSDSIEFTMQGQVEVNRDWLDTLFPSAEEDLKDDLLIRLGFLQEDGQGNVTPIEVRDLGSCWRALKDRVHEWEWHAVRGADPWRQAWNPGKEKAEGIHPRMLAFKEELSPYLKGLVEDLREIAKVSDADLAKTALTALLPGTGKGQTQDLVRTAKTVAQLSLLNPEQLRVVQDSLSKTLTVVQGPPGTGKSTVVRSVLLSHGINDQSGLFASRNHRAVDAVVHPLALEEHAPCIIADVRQKERSVDWIGLLMENLDCDDEELMVSLQHLRESIDDCWYEASVIERNLIELQACAMELAQVQEQLGELDEQHPEWEDRHAEVDLGSCPGRVHEIMQACHRPWWKPMQLWARWRRRNMLSRAQKGPHGRDIHGVADLEQLTRWRNLQREQTILEQRVKDEFPRPAELGERLFESLDGQVREMNDALPGLPEIWAGKVRAKHQLLAMLNNERRSGSGSRAGSRRLKALATEHFEDLLPGLPLWAITNLSVRRQVPRVPAAFDLAIVDEAGQCDPASVLPILFRAKRALIVGDPQQLRPVGQLGLAREDTLRRKHGLDGPEFTFAAQAGRSAYEMAHDVLISREEKPTLLREHYRCHPVIARFFSQEFYDSKLILRTSSRDIGDLDGGIRWTDVEGGSQTQSGSRWHPPQVEAIVRELEQLAGRGFDGTVGVVTPFREHAKRIRDTAYARLGHSKLDRDWQFVADTADGFQGGEKDLVLLGLVGGGNGDNPTPPFYKRDRNRFNVAVSRARLLLHVFGDRSWASSCGVPVLEHLVRAAEPVGTDQGEDVRRDLIGPVWEPLLAERLTEEGIDYRQQYPTCGFYLDFGLFPRRDKARKINIEVDGETWHRDSDGNLRDDDVRRDLILRANGWRIQRFWVYQLREDMDGCIQKIKDLLSHD